MATANEVKHAPGPFATNGQFIKAKGQIIAEVFMLDNSGNPTLPREANAALFTAAPDLLSVLKKTIPLLQAAQRKGLLDEVLATIAKAEGR